MNNTLTLSLKDCVNTLQLMPDKMVDKLFKSCLRKACRSTIAAARRAARDPSKGQRKDKKAKPRGVLAASIGIKVKMLQDKTFLWAGVGPRTGGVKEYSGFHGYMVEFGHRQAVGGSIERKNGRPAPLQKQGKFYQWSVLQGRHSSARRRQKALNRYLAGVAVGTPLTAQVLASATYRKNLDRLLTESTGQRPITSWFAGAVATGGIIQKAYGKRGEGKVVGEVKAYPFLGPVFDANRGNIASTMQNEVRSRCNAFFTEMAGGVKR